MHTSVVPRAACRLLDRNGNIDCDGMAGETGDVPQCDKIHSHYHCDDYSYYYYHYHYHYYHYYYYYYYYYHYY